MSQAVSRRDGRVRPSSQTPPVRVAYVTRAMPRIAASARGSGTSRATSRQAPAALPARPPSKTGQPPGSQRAARQALSAATVQGRRVDRPRHRLVASAMMTAGKAKSRPKRAGSGSAPPTSAPVTVAASQAPYSTRPLPTRKPPSAAVAVVSAQFHPPGRRARHTWRMATSLRSDRGWSHRGAHAAR